MAGIDDVRRVAVRMFAERGYAATGIRDIGRGAGLTSGALYHYAQGKEALLVDVMRTALEDLLRLAVEAVDFSPDPTVRLARLVRTHVANQIVNRDTSTVTDTEIRALSTPNRREILALRDDYESVWQQVLDRGVRTAEFDLADRAVTRLALIGMCNSVIGWYAPTGRLDLAALQDHFVRLSGRMVGAAVPDADQCGPDVVVARLPCEPLAEGAAAPGPPGPTARRETSSRRTATKPR